MNFKIFSDSLDFLVLLHQGKRTFRKDSYEIYFCLLHHPGGPDALVSGFKPFMDNKLVSEGLKKIAEQFALPDHTGPVHIVNFEGITDDEERERIQRDAFERAHYLLPNLGLRWPPREKHMKLSGAFKYRGTDSIQAHPF